MYFLGPLGSKGRFHIYDSDHIVSHIHIKGVATPLQQRVVSGAWVVLMQLIQFEAQPQIALQPESCVPLVHMARNKKVWHDLLMGVLIQIDTPQSVSKA